MKKLMMVLAVCFLAGCAQGSNVTRAESMKVTTRDNNLMHYAEALRDAVEAEFPDAGQYAGKTCTVRINMARDGMLMAANAEGGDPALCSAALEALRKAKIPPAPTDEIYQTFKNAPLDFAP
ncbi:cell envelope integrity protein TolA [Enterobacter bugandensis]|uniref:cell envelope integrity protein TolA n=1 Tax=Enterobacter bugandensis TaxID=881260 RepID=UPI0020065FAA|nr:cell envelope integrity protein TolA [Enterobacter bugandensis]MCK7435934.1 cell envelope integrity protein TolA [Enterobacter bugandensis]